MFGFGLGFAWSVYVLVGWCNIDFGWFWAGFDACVWLVDGSGLLLSLLGNVVG